VLLIPEGTGGGLAAVSDEAIHGVVVEAIQMLEARIGELARTVGRMEDAGVAEEVIRAALSTEDGAGRSWARFRRS
jgi:hypothetical protein